MKQLLLTLGFGVCFGIGTFAQVNWQHTNGPEGGTTGYIFNNDQYAFYPDEHFLYRSADGETWEQLPYGNLAPISGMGSTLVAQRGWWFGSGAADPSFVVSHDHGTTWTEATMPPTKYGQFYDIDICSQGIFVPDAYGDVLLRSQDEGLSWDTLLPPGLHCIFVYTFDDRLYLNSDYKYYRLALNGTDWEPVSPPFGTSDYPTSFFASGNSLFCATEHNLWGSDDGGANWHKTPIPFYNFENRFIKIGNRVYKIADYASLYYTEDSGLTWTKISGLNGSFIYELASVNGKLIYSTDDEGVLVFDETVSQGTAFNNGLFSARTTNFSTDDENLWCSTPLGLHAYNLSDKTWVEHSPVNAESTYYSMVAVSPNGTIATFSYTQEALFLSHDHGTTWDTIYPLAGIPFQPYLKFIGWMGDALLVKSSNGDDLRSTDFGLTWTSTYVPVNFVALNGQYYTSTFNGMIDLTSDQGATYTQIAIPGIQYIAYLYAAEDRLFLVGAPPNAPFALYSSPDGQNWQYSNDGLPPMYFDWDAPFTPYRGGIWSTEGKYFLHQPSIGFYVSLDTCKTWLPLERQRFEHMAFADSTFFGGTYQGGVFSCSVPDNYGALSSGLVFKDDNNNGVHEPGEDVLPNVKVSLFEPTAWYPYWFANTKSDGQYAIGSTPGSADTLRPVLKNSYIEQINPPQYIVSGSNSNRNFGVYFKPDVTDLSVSGNYFARPRPGYPLTTNISYRNDGTIPAGGIVSAKLDPRINYQYATPAPSAVFGNDSLVWNTAQLTLFERQNIQVHGVLQASTALGTWITVNAYIHPDTGDETPDNNMIAIRDSAVGSYDPNEKRVEPARGITEEEIAAGKELQYTIQFQNTGTYQADRVRITDHLDTALNLSTLRLVSASHPVTGFKLLPGGLLEIVFDNILLPDSNSNEVASHGYVTFAIQRNKLFNPGIDVRNRAAIYFDFNEPIITNTVSTKVVSTAVSTSEPVGARKVDALLKATPNPASTTVTITSSLPWKGGGELELLNSAGQICVQRAVADFSYAQSVSVAALPDGVYLIRFTGKEGVLTGKVVVKH